MNQAAQSILPGIFSKQITTTLSPFTWNNIKLPILNNKHRYDSKDLQKNKIVLHEIKQQPKLQNKKKKQTIDKKRKILSVFDKSERNFSKQIHKQMSSIQQNKKQKPYLTIYSKSVMNKTIQIDKKQKISNLINKQVTIVNKTSQKQKQQQQNNNKNIIKQKFTKQNVKPNNVIQGCQILQSSFKLKKQIFKDQTNLIHIFILPQDQQQLRLQNHHVLIKLMLKGVVDDINNYLKKQNITIDIKQTHKICLGSLLQTLKIKNLDITSKILIKMFMYLQIHRKQLDYFDYFESFNTYINVDISPKPHLFDQVIQKSLLYLDTKSQRLNIESIDLRIMALALHFDELFQQKCPSYFKQTQWLRQKEYNNKKQIINIKKQWFKKQKNLISQQKQAIIKFIFKPLLLQSEDQKINNKKFYIKQPVLLLSLKNQPLIYQYDNPMLLFSKLNYKQQQFNEKSHFFNEKQAQIINMNEIKQKGLVLLNNQMQVKIQNLIKKSILNNQQIKYTQNNFQLLFYNFIIDKNNNFILTSISLQTLNHLQKIPSFQNSLKQIKKYLYPILKQKIYKNNQKWKLIYGESILNSIDNPTHIQQRIQVKPYYKYLLSQKQSFIYMIRNRKKNIQILQSKLHAFILKYSLKKIKAPIIIFQQPKQDKSIQGTVQILEERDVLIQ